MVTATIRRPLSGRRAQKEIFARLLASDHSELVAVYGRRRVGKTFLVRRYFQDASVDYFEMVGQFEGSVTDHLRIFSEALSQAFYQGAPLAPPASWHEAFGALTRAVEAAPRSKKKRKTVLFFDELPWIATHRSRFLAELEHFWNAWCTRRDDIVLIVCGSAASWMLQKIVHARGGLHNRLTQTIRLLPFTVAEVREFLEDGGIRPTDRQLAELLMVFGGVPHYLDHLTRGQSVPQLVDRICFRKGGALVGELDRLFASLFGSDPKYLAVVRGLAQRRRGSTRNELLAGLRLPSGGGVTTILENLEEGGFITATIPFDRTARDLLYRLTDPFTLFYLKWMSARPPVSWQRVHGTPAWHTWAGLAFESFCLQNVPAIEQALGISGVRTTASAWLHADAQIDLLIDRADDVISVCEVKFTEAPFTITKKYAEELRNKLAVFRQQTGTRKQLQLVLISASGLVSNPHAEELVDRTITLEEIVGRAASA